MRIAVTSSAPITGRALAAAHVAGASAGTAGARKPGYLGALPALQPMFVPTTNVPNYTDQEFRPPRGSTART